MNRVLSFFLAVFVCTSCDDGDLVFQDINFSDVAANKCDNKIYKISNSEALILKIGNSDLDVNFTAFPLEPTEIDQPTKIIIDNSDNKVVYRLYDGEVSTANICGSIPAAFPAIVEEWEATSGEIQITTRDVIIANTKEGYEGGQKITGYQHNIVLNDVTFKKADGSSQVYDVFPFGVYEKTITPLSFNFGDTALQKCLSSNIVFKTVGAEAFSINLDPALLSTTSPGVAKTGIVSTDLNAVNYFLFPANTLINQELLCGPNPSVAPRQRWTGVAGEQNFSGIVEVVANPLPGGNGFSYTIRLKKLTLKKDRNEFLLADDYLFGVLNITN